MTKTNIISATLLSLILVGCGGGITFEQKKAELKSKVESKEITETEGIRQLLNLEAKWREVSEDTQDTEKYVFKLKRKYNCYDDIGSLTFHGNKSLNEQYKDTIYKNFKFNKENYFYKSVKLIKNKNYRPGWSGITCEYTVFPKDKERTID